MPNLWLIVFSASLYNNDRILSERYEERDQLNETHEEIFTILIAAVFCLSLAACGGSEEPVGDDRRSSGGIVGGGPSENTFVPVCVNKTNASFYYDSEEQVRFNSVDYPITFAATYQKLSQKVYFESASRVFQNGSESVKLAELRRSTIQAVCASSEIGDFADDHDYAQPEGVSKRFRGGENAKMRRSAIHDGTRFVGAWRFCRLLSVLGHPCIKRFGTPVYQAFWDALFVIPEKQAPDSR